MNAESGKERSRSREIGNPGEAAGDADVKVQPTPCFITSLCTTNDENKDGLGKFNA